MNDSIILDQLYVRKGNLETQLEATKHAIIGFGGKIKTDKKPIVAIEVIPQETKKEKKKHKKNSKLAEVEGYIIEILKEEDRPVTANDVQLGLKSLGFDYKLQSVYAYLSTMAKKKSIIRPVTGHYVHADYKEADKLQTKVHTILEVGKYFELRKEVTRKELIAHFVTGGRMTENMLQGRLEKLINDEKIIRKEQGVYKLKKK